MDAPRRCYIERRCLAETDISVAIETVEAMPADVRLTEAVNLLEQARDKVSDYVDEWLANHTPCTCSPPCPHPEQRGSQHDVACPRYELTAVPPGTENPMPEGETP
jgi:hypothetical protein